MGQPRDQRVGGRSLPSQFHSTSVEKGPRRLSSLISKALSFDDADAYAAGEVGFMARALVQATMPHSDPKTNEFVRQNGHYSLSILAPKDVGLPYGRYPRLVLAYLNTEAVERKTRHIEIDIYVWLTWRFFRLRKPVTIPWDSLQLQFGCGYKNPRHFKRRFLKYLGSVVSYYPEARVGTTVAGLLLKPAPPHVAPRIHRTQRWTAGAWP